MKGRKVLSMKTVEDRLAKIEEDAAEMTKSLRKLDELGGSEPVARERKAPGEGDPVVPIQTMDGAGRRIGPDSVHQDDPVPRAPGREAGQGIAAELQEAHGLLQRAPEPVEDGRAGAVVPPEPVTRGGEDNGHYPPQTRSMWSFRKCVEQEMQGS